MLDLTCQKGKLRPRITIIQGHLFLVDHGANSFLSLRMLDIRHFFISSPPVSETIDICELGFTDVDFGLPPDSEVVIDEATVPSLCSFHWKEERERVEVISVQIYSRVAHFGKGSPGWSVIFRYAFTPRKSEAEPPMLTLLGRNAVDPRELSSDGKPAVLHCLIEQLPLSLRALMLRATINKYEKPFFDLVISVPKDKASAKGSTLAVSSVPGRLDIDEFSVDHLSGAVIHTGKGDRWIKIAYPA